MLVGTFRNSDDWRDYLKKVIDKQIEYGAEAIQIDESAMPFDAIMCGAGYCESCLKNFYNFLVERYGKEQLAKKGIKNWKKLRFYLILHRTGYIKAHLLIRNFPFWKDYRISQLRNIRRTFLDLVNYIKRKSSKILVTGNFVDLAPYYIPLIKHVDILTFELNFRFPPEKNAPFYILAHSLAEGKDIAVVPSVITSYILQKKKLKS